MTDGKSVLAVTLVVMTASTAFYTLKFYLQPGMRVALNLAEINDLEEKMKANNLNLTTTDFPTTDDAIDDEDINATTVFTTLSSTGTTRIILDKNANLLSTIESLRLRNTKPPAVVRSAISEDISSKENNDDDMYQRRHMFNEIRMPPSYVTFENESEIQETEEKRTGRKLKDVIKKVKDVLTLLTEEHDDSDN